MTALTRCLCEEAAAIRAAADRLSSDQVEATLDLLNRCSDSGAKLVISGVGKSGIVARKIAATFTSLGLMAIYLNPLDALHGDLGVVGPEDIALLLSNSGETQELLEMLPHLKRRESTLIALVGRLNSTLAQECDLVLDGSVNKEVCPLNLAPTASTAVAMAIGDALAAVWMERRGISREDFALNHPAGSLGRQLTLTAGDLMVSRSMVEGLDPESSLSLVIGALTAAGIGASWIHRPGEPSQLAGLITDGDLRRALQQYPASGWGELTAKQLMTVDPITITSDVLAIDALRMMECNTRKPISVLPVLDNSGELKGLLRLHDLVQAGLG